MGLIAQLLNWPSCSPRKHLDHHEIKNATKTNRTIAQLEFSIRKGWEQLLSLVPTCLRPVVKRRGDVTMVNMSLWQLFKDMLLPLTWHVLL